jgi:hypothetical protein
MQQHTFLNPFYTSLSILMLLLFSVNIIFAQPGSNENEDAEIPNFQRTERPLPQADTTQLHYFYWQNIANRKGLNDTTLEGFQQYDMARQGEFYDYIHIGDVGSAAKPLAFTPTARRGFDIGLHAYDIYQIRYDDTRFFDVTKAYTRAYFSQAMVQTDLIFMATYAANFKKKSGNVSMDYRRISETALYDNQFARHTNLRVNGWFQNKNKRYTGRGFRM